MRLSEHDVWAAEHHGLLTLAQCGLSNDAWHRAIRAGTIIKIHRHVARLPGTPQTLTQRIAAAVLAANPGAIASHRSAAHLLGIDRPDDDTVDLILADPKRHVDLDGVVVHRPSDRKHLIPQNRQGVACTNIIRTLCDLGAVTRRDEVFEAVGTAMNERLVTIGTLRSAVKQHAKPGRAGIPALREALDRWEIDRRPADSVLELAFVELCRAHRLPAFTFHERIGGWEVDFRFVGTQLIVECDGWSTHGLDRDQFERDRVKDAELMAAGWQVIRLTYRSIIDQPVAAAGRLRRALDRLGDA